MKEMYPFMLALDKEAPAGKTWKGKPVYRKVVYVGNLPNSTSLSVPHGIEDIDEVVFLNGVARSGTEVILLPLIDTVTPENNIWLSASTKDNITIVASRDRSAFQGHVTVEYIKS